MLKMYLQSVLMLLDEKWLFLVSTAQVFRNHREMMSLNSKYYLPRRKSRYASDSSEL